MSGLKCYATIGQMRVRQGLKTLETADDGRLLDKLRAATQAIERWTGNVFQPVIETRTFDWYSASRLQFRGYSALQLTSVTDGLGFVVASTALIPLGGTQSTFGASIGPFYGVEAIPANGGYFFYLTTRRRCMQVAGTWGWHDDFANAWYASGVTVQDAPLSNSATTITTSTNDSTITDGWGKKWPTDANVGTVQPGHLIQIESEWLQVVSYTDATHIIVQRGVNGTTAASHAQNTAIQLYATPRDINDICLRWASWLFAQDSVSFEKTVIPMMGETRVPAGFPRDIVEALRPYRNVRIA